MHNIGTGLVLALATLVQAEQPPVDAVSADLEADITKVQQRIPSQRASIRREFGLDTQIERLGASDDDASQDYCERHVHRTCYEQGQHWNRNLDDDVAVFAPSPPGSCKTCAYSSTEFGSSRVYNCQTCEPGYEIVVFFSDCAGPRGNQTPSTRRHRNNTGTGVCADRELKDYLVDRGLATLDSSACRAKAPCYDDDTIEGRIEGATNDYYPGQVMYSYSYDSDWHRISQRCEDLAVEWAVCAIDFGITFDDDFFRGRDDDRQASTDDGTLATCGEIQGSIEFAASCANTAMVQVCAEKYYPYVECLYEAAAIHASDGDLVCTELDCAAALGSSTSSAVAARPAALVAFTCAALVLYWAAVPIAR